MTDLFMLLAVIALALIIREFLFEPVRVKGNSMLSTLHNGEMMLVTKLDYRLNTPSRHDVVICHYPGRYVDKWKLIPQYFVKRLIGLPGETVEIREGTVFIDGAALDEPYLDPAHTRFRRDMEPVTLGADEYFVMGDNRDNSNDSRRVGPLTRGQIRGHVRWVFFPLRSWRSVR